MVIISDTGPLISLAESKSINCIGSLGVLVRAKNAGLIDALQPLFKMLLENNRYYSISLLNRILQENNENM